MTRTPHDDNHHHLRAKLEDPTHPMTRMLSNVHELASTGAFNTTTVKTDDDSGEEQRFASTLVRALQASNTREHYEAMYALWDDAPFRDISRMLIKLIYKFILSSYDCCTPQPP